MIKTLHISNYALIEELDIDFESGFNIITGETGAGKSIILGALSLLLGGRAETKAIGDSGKKSVIEAVFTVENRPDLKQYCLSEDIEWDEEECVLRREISPSGRSRAFVNDSPVNLDRLREVAVRLVDIHSQHQNLLLASPPYQMRILDVLAGNQSRLQEYSELYAAYRQALKSYAVTRRNIEKANADEEFMRYQLARLKKAELVPDEQAALEQERDLLTNMTEVKDLLRSVTNSLSDGSPSALGLLKDAVTRGRELADMLEDASELTDRLEEIRVEIQDVAESFRYFDRDLVADPSALASVEERLNEIYDLQRRFHVDSVGELIAIRGELENKINRIENADDELQQLEAAARAAKKKCMNLAKEISAARTDEAAKFSSLLRDKAMPLGMKNLTVRIDVTPAELSSTGIDDVEFFFAFNKNQEPLPVGKTASGGEISRLMLSIKSIVASKMELPAIIFDEVDTGVSGDVANRMGEMMKDIARNIQVITITHLPQVAAKGNAHFKVYKEDTDTRTTTRIGKLDKEGRVNELAAMLGGSNSSEAARANAEALLDNK